MGENRRHVEVEALFCNSVAIFINLPKKKNTWILPSTAPVSSSQKCILSSTNTKDKSSFGTFYKNN